MFNKNLSTTLLQLFFRFMLNSKVIFRGIVCHDDPLSRIFSSMKGLITTTLALIVIHLPRKRSLKNNALLYQKDQNYSSSCWTIDNCFNTNNGLHYSNLTRTLVPTVEYYCSFPDNASTGRALSDYRVGLLLLAITVVIKLLENVKYFLMLYFDFAEKSKIVKIQFKHHRVVFKLMVN